MLIEVRLDDLGLFFFLDRVGVDAFEDAIKATFEVVAKDFALHAQGLGFWIKLDRDALNFSGWLIDVIGRLRRQESQGGVRDNTMLSFFSHQIWPLHFRFVATVVWHDSNTALVRTRFRSVSRLVAPAHLRSTVEDWYSLGSGSSTCSALLS